MVIFAIVCCHGNRLQYTHMNENGIPGVLLNFTVNARSLNPKLKQILHFQFVILFQVQILLKLQGVTLSWNTHIETVCKKISSALGLIKRIRDIVPFYTLLNIFNGLVKPQFDYCSLVWDCCSTGLAEKLQKLQNRAARILLSAPYDSSATDLFRRLQWKNLRNQRLFAKPL